MLVLAGVLALASFAALRVGSVEAEGEVAAHILSLRGARLVAGFLAGAALAVSGVMVQGLFRNPLASPSILGTTAGASLGGQLALLLAQLAGFGVSHPELLVPFGCLAGALLSLAVLLVFVRRASDRLTLLLVGFVLGSLFLSLGGLVTSVAQERWELGRAVVAFALGSLGGVGTRQVLFAAPLVLGGFVAALLWARPLDLLLSGEAEARSLGVDVHRVRRWVVVWVSLLVAASVSMSGSIAFVGLVAPHALRPFVGELHRRLLPAAALAGGAFVVLCDVAARALPSRGEVPLGVVTGLVGAPLFLFLLFRGRREAVGE
ncbi:MAG: iron ABC transporter [Sandaracinus sp.]|nr:iron ABC transporter [Sandaracinus sp.]|tara:strand:- start:2911 stop:3867 length:957 start_codon:yes stop_codon:yes gene_type:complete